MTEYLINELSHLNKAKAKIGEAFMNPTTYDPYKTVSFVQEELAVLEKVLMGLTFIQK